MARLSTFLAWWLRELASCLPAGWRRAIGLPPDAVLAELQGAHLKLTVRRLDHTSDVIDAGAAMVPGDSTVRRLQQLGAKSLPVLVRVDQGVLRKVLQLPAAARRNIDQLVAFEIDRETPFEPEEIFWTCRAEAGHGPQLAVELAIVQRAAVTPTLDALRAHGLEARAIELADRPGRPQYIALGVGRPFRGKVPQRPLQLLAIANLGLLLALAALPLWQQHRALSAVERQLADLQAQVRAASERRQRDEQRTRLETAVADLMGDRPDPLAVLAAATAAVPDDAHLDSLTLADGRLSLSGTAISAARVVTRFAQAPTFTQPELTGPVVRAPDGRGERFSIGLRLRAAGAEP